VTAALDAEEANGTMSDHLRHARNIHFLILSVAFLMIYTVISSYTDMPELHRELSGLRDLLEVADGHAPRDFLAAHGWWVRNTRTRLSRDYLNNWLSQDEVFTENLSYQYPALKFDRNAVLSDLMTQLDQLEVFVRYPVRPVEEDQDTLRDFVYLRSLGTGNVRYCKLTSFKPEWQRTTSVNYVTVYVALTCDAVPDPNRVYGGSKVIAATKIRFYADTAAVRLFPGGWFMTYPHLAAHFRELGDKKLEQALVLSSERLAEKVPDQSFPLLGIPVRGRHLAAVSLCTQLFLFVYLMLYLREAQRCLPKTHLSEGASLAWLAVSPSRGAQLLGLATLSVLPAIAAYLVLYRLVRPSYLWLLVALLYAGAGLMSWLEAQLLGRALA